jgi:hypothetical protein
MKATDWLGNEYGVDDDVMYIKGSSSSKAMSLGTVLDIWQVCQVGWSWRKLAEGEEPPMVEKLGRWDWKTEKRGPDTKEPARVELRVKVRPHNKLSRGYRYSDYRSKWNGTEYETISHPIRPVTLQITDNITKA